MTSRDQLDDIVTAMGNRATVRGDTAEALAAEVFVSGQSLPIEAKDQYHEELLAFGALRDSIDAAAELSREIVSRRSLRGLHDLCSYLVPDLGPAHQLFEGSRDCTVGHR